MNRSIMRSKFKALGWHFLYSSILVGLSALLVHAWYPEWFFWLDGGIQLLYLLAPIDLVLGPILMFVVFNPSKSTKERLLDISVILILQWIALGYGLWQAYQQKPLGLYFTGDSLVACPQNWYARSNNPEPAHDVMQAYMLRPGFEDVAKVLDLMLTHGINECVLTKDMVPATTNLPKIKQSDLAARQKLMLKGDQQVKKGEVAIAYYGRYGNAVVIFDDQKLSVLTTHYLEKL